MEGECGIEKTFGCAKLNSIMMDFPGDIEVHSRIDHIKKREKGNEAAMARGTRGSLASFSRTAPSNGRPWVCTCVSSRCCARLPSPPSSSLLLRELAELSWKFMRTAQVTYVRALEDLRPAKAALQRGGPLARDTILEFFDACNARMSTPAFRHGARASYEATQQPPSQLIIDAQRELLEIFGIEKEHGCQRLGQARAQPRRPSARRGAPPPPRRF